MTGNDYEQLQAMGQQQRDAEPTGAIKVGEYVRIKPDTEIIDSDTHLARAKALQIVGTVHPMKELDNSGRVCVEFPDGTWGYFDAEELELMKFVPAHTPTPEPDALAAANDERREKMWAALDTIIARGDRIEALEKAIARIEQLEAVLRPFADAAESAVTQVNQGYTRHLYVLDTHNEPKVVTVGENGMLSINHLRAAAEALAKGARE